MQSQSPIIDQLSKALTEAMGAADGVRREAETLMRSQIQRFIAAEDLVPREEFEILKDRVAALATENEQLRSRLAEIENAEPQTGRMQTA